MTEMLWYDPIDVVRTGNKRHIYEEERGAYIRVCGTEDRKGLARQRTEIEHEEKQVILNDNNVCQNCLKASGLHHLVQESPGAENVEYDPFDVFGKSD